MHIKSFFNFGMLLSLSIVLVTTRAAEKSVDISLSVDQHKWSGIRLQNLIKGTQLKTSLTIDGEAEIFFLNSSQYSHFPNLKTAPIFHSSTSEKLEFNLVIPKSDHYVMVVDNRSGKNKLSFSFHFYASLETLPLKKRSGDSSLAIQKINKQLTSFSKTLQKAFIFDNIDINLIKCGKSNAFSTSSSIFLCVEYVQSLILQVSNKQKIQDILLFTLTHEIGHVLLKQWKYPFNDNEEVIDELATVILTMFNQRQAAQTQADFFDSLPTEQEIRITINKDTRHPLSIQRARNIRRWLNSPETIKTWQKLLIPFMQTKFLKHLSTQSAEWVNKSLIIQELSRR